MPILRVGKKVNGLYRFVVMSLLALALCDLGRGVGGSARSLFTHLRDALEHHDMHGETTLIIAGDGSVIVDRDGEREIVYRPKQRSKNQ